MWLEVNMTRDGLAQGAGCRSGDRTSTRLPVKTESMQADGWVLQAGEDTYGGGGDRRAGLGEETRGNRMAPCPFAEVEVELEDTGDGRSWAPTLQFHYVSPAPASQERGSRLAMRRLVKKVRGPRVTRFSPREMLTLAQEAARRVGPLYGHGGALANAATRRRAWAEIAHAVRAHSIFPRTRDQCRRRWDDLRRWAKRKALRAAGSAELTGIKRLPVGVVLTRPEELALGTFPELSMEGLAVWDVGWSARGSIDRGDGAEPPAMVAAGADAWPDEKAVDLLVLGPVAPLVGGPLHYAAAKSTEEGADESSSISDVERGIMWRRRRKTRKRRRSGMRRSWRRVRTRHGRREAPPLRPSLWVDAPSPPSPARRSRPRCPAQPRPPFFLSGSPPVCPTGVRMQRPLTHPRPRPLALP
ncbi:myb-related transcription factor, partner of profilin-like isoform X2 [Lethenteron reissneri]|nr:myb-related transcription factor, partner of profilin-like isoform X2 [Lethenteron reissneri]XP_061435261.1 myb-related transcription factor, partner of profilin-like isoform X2 [Lethenteron reissneri]